MTIAEQIMGAVGVLVGPSPDIVFTREQIRSQAGVDKDVWQRSYSPIFQGMREDQPGGAPNVSAKYKNVFRNIGEQGKYVLTKYGKSLLASLPASPGSDPKSTNPTSSASIPTSDSASIPPPVKPGWKEMLPTVHLVLQILAVAVGIVATILAIIWRSNN